MPSDLRSIHTGNLEDLIHVLRGSSEGFVFQFDVDLYGFLALSRFWNFSYEHSFLAYAGGQPAGALLNSVDPSTREAFSFYWGVLPEFRGGRVAMSLVDAYFRLLRREGYSKTDADETTGSPSSVYRKLGYHRNEGFAEIQTRELHIASACEEFDIRPVDLDQLLPSWSDFPGFRHWVQRPNFLRNAARFIKILAAFKNEQLCGYVVLTCSSGHLVICDFRFKTRETGLAILRYIADSDYPPPYVVSFVPSPSPAYQLLDELGFAGVKRFTSMTLHLSSSSSQFVRRTAG
jgi:GNAT superfamily N-acetyltransferase